MRKMLHWAIALSMAALAWGAAPARKKAPVKKTAPKSSATVRKAPPKSPAKSAAARKGKKGPARTGAKPATWRNRQLVPAPERYREIQDALAAKGYLSRESANGKWDQTCVESLKRFQTDQHLESSGKINSLSLIALGLGPKRDTPPADAGGGSRQ